MMKMKMENLPADGLLDGHISASKMDEILQQLPPPSLQERDDDSKQDMITSRCMQVHLGKKMLSSHFQLL